MFGIGMPEMILIAAVALIVIGPKKLPELAKSLGRALGEFKRATSDLKDSIQIETGMDDVRDSFKDVKTGLKNSLDLDEETPAGDADEKTESQPDDPISKVGEAFKAMNADTADAPTTQTPQATETEETDAPEPSDRQDPPVEDPTGTREKDRS